MDSELQAALELYDKAIAQDVYPAEEAVAIIVEAIIVEAARKYANPLDEFWYCEAHDRDIDIFDDALKPKSCLYEGRSGDCKPILVLVVRKEAPDGQ